MVERKRSKQCQLGYKVIANRHIYIFAVIFNDFEIPEETEQIGRGVFVLQNMKLKYLFQKNCQITDQKMTFDCFLLLQEYRSGIQI